jgi:hypothetical protein
MGWGYHGLMEYDDWLVVWNIFYVPFHKWDVILPIDELHHFSRLFFNHQPDENYIQFNIAMEAMDH